MRISKTITDRDNNSFNRKINIITSFVRFFKNHKTREINSCNVLFIERIYKLLVITYYMDNRRLEG